MLLAKKIATNKFFVEYTNVRRIITIYISQISPSSLNKMMEYLAPDILVFMMTDPILTEHGIFEDMQTFATIFKKHYRKFTEQRILKQEETNNNEIYQYMFAGDQQLLPKQFALVYEDTLD